MPDLLNPSVQKAMTVLADGFVFRKLGICYDLRATPEDFPAKVLPTAKEISQGKPDAHGSHTGMSEAGIHNALLFDGYALRLEIGFAAEEEDRIFDRLIGGAIRLATIAPKGALIGGLSPDGKSYYPDAGVENYLAWAFYAWRAVVTATVAPESQGKLKNIAQRWIARLEADSFLLPGGDDALNQKTWDRQPLLPAILAAAWALTGEEKWKKLALQKAEFTASLPDLAEPKPLLITQMALHTFAEIMAGEELADAAKERQKDLLPLAARHLESYRNFVPAEEIAGPDWREIPAEGELPPAWKSILHEKSSLTAAAMAALACLFCKDKEALEPYAPTIAAMLQETAWDKARLASSLCPVVAAHARGVELGLWDTQLGEYSFGFDIEKTLVERFMQPEFDEQHPLLAGHMDSPEKPAPAGEEGGEKTGRRRRRRRKRK